MVASSAQVHNGDGHMIPPLIAIELSIERIQESLMSMIGFDPEP
jgi:hypothetical protein